MKNQKDPTKYSTEDLKEPTKNPTKDPTMDLKEPAKDLTKDLFSPAHRTQTTSPASELGSLFAAQDS